MAILETVLVYLGLFAAVYILLVAEERTRDAGRRAVLLAAAVLLPALLSGFRAESVGTDTPMYLECIRAWAATGAWPPAYMRFEIGFKALVRLFTACSDSPQVVLSCFHVLIFGVALWAFVRLRSLAPLRLTYVFYLFICLTQSWNALRQMTACSFILLGFAYLVRGCPARFLLAMSASVLFHKSSVVGFALFPLAIFSNASAKIFLGMMAALAAFGLALVVALMPEYAHHLHSFTGGTRHAIIKHMLTCAALAVAVFHLSKTTDGIRIFAWRKALPKFLGESVLLVLVLQFFHFSIDWADRLLVTFMPIIAFVCAYVFARGSRMAKLVSFAYVVPYSFFYHYVVCNQNECNVYAFAL